MDSNQIKTGVDVARFELEKCIMNNKNIYELNPRIRELQNTISNYQKICEHKYQNGKCIYCGKIQGGK